VNLAFALAAAVLFGTGAFMLLKRDLVRVVIGVSLVSHSAVVTVLGAALTRGQAPILPVTGRSVSDPLVQSLALTALVIGMAVLALLLVLVYRVASAYSATGLDEVAAAEAARDEELERASERERLAEEAEEPEDEDEDEEPGDDVPVPAGAGR
jgi:multicomponent Na+:H+ antiporter subunit C